VGTLLPASPEAHGRQQWKASVVLAENILPAYLHPCSVTAGHGGALLPALKGARLAQDCQGWRSDAGGQYGLPHPPAARRGCRVAADGPDHAADRSHGPAAA
jgi:hypothetical protein